MSLSAGDRFDRYVIEDLLGEGGMARVYRARDPRLHRRVALKVLRVSSGPSPDGGPDATELVLREARASAALDHPNAVSVFDVGEADGELFIAMELVNGKSLRSFVNDASVAWDTKLRWMVDAARALGAAHERGLVHRDVKPENIMVRHDGVVKVLDFGIAKRTMVELAGGPGTFDEPRTQSVASGILGTPWYLAPEQLRGETVIDGRVDQFAWAVTTYELLTGVLPWPKGVDGFQLVLAILNATPEPPSKRVPELPSIAEAALLKALAKSPAQRFESMGVVVTALEGLTSPSRRSWAEVHTAATTKTDPAPPMAPDSASPMTPPQAVPTEGSVTLPTLSPARGLSRSVTGALALAAAAAIGLFAAKVTHHAPAEAAVPSATPLAAPSASDHGPFPLTALPVPRSSVPEAVSAYRTYLQSFRDGDWSSAERAIETAAERDPTMAAAQLRLAFLCSLETAREGTVRSAFHTAMRYRGNLDEHDVGLLDALEPYLQGEPSDPLESMRRLSALHARFPHDAEIAYVLASVTYDRGDLSAALTALDEVTAIDPGFEQAQSARGGVLAYLGRFDEAQAALEEVVRRSPTATEALWYQAQLAEQSGRCADQERIAHAWIARDPDDAFAYSWLASALAGQGRPADTVRTALQQKWTRLDGKQRPKREAIDAAMLDAFVGDFTAAEGKLRALEQVLTPEPGAQAHGEPQLTLVDLEIEQGHPDDARDVASAYLARKDAWVPAHRVDDAAILLDPVPTMLGALARAGAITFEQRRAQRQQWLDAWRAKTSSAYLGALWVTTWARPSASADDAAEALAALPSLGGLPVFVPTEPWKAWLGRVQLQAGHPAEAIDALRAAVASCTSLDNPVAYVRAWHDLGVALAARDAAGNRAAACDAYGQVLARWGHAKPRSITADDARARSKALGCGPGAPGAGHR